MIRRFGDFLAWLGGADSEVLRVVPGERPKFTQMAGVLLTTAGLAVLSMAFALHDGLKTDWFWAVTLGLLWGVVILNLDRLLVISLGTVQGRGRLLLMAVPRLLMAAVLAVVISTPLVLRVFADSIEVQLVKSRLETSAELKRLQENSAEKEQLDSISARIAANREILAGKLPQSFTSPRLQSAQARVATMERRLETAQEKYKAAYREMRCELYGAGAGGVDCSGASERPGRGPLWREKQQEAAAARKELANVRAQLRKARGEVTAEQNAITEQRSRELAEAQRKARADLAEQEAEYRKVAGHLRTDADDGTASNQANDGLPAQIAALFAIGEQDGVLAIAHLAVFLLFFMIELLPVVVKVLLKLGPPSPYDTVAQSRADARVEEERLRRSTGLRVAEIAARDEAAAEEGRSRVRTSVEADMRAREEILGKQANAHVAAEMTKILDVALREWSEKVRQQLAAAGPAPRPAAPAGGPAGGPAAPEPVNGARPASPRTTSVFGLPSGDDL